MGVSLIHNSLGDPNRYMHVGPKWAMSYDSWLSTPDNGNTVTVSWADGRAYSFSKNVNSTYSSVPGIYDTLTKPSATEFDILTKDQTRYRFVFIVNTYFLASVSDENGNTLTLTRDGSAHVKTITDASNRTITLAYDASNRLSTVSDPLSRLWVINYDSNGDLGRIDYPALNGTVHSRYFAYNYPAHDIAQMTQMDNARHSYYSYNSDDTIAWEQDPMGNRTTFSYGVDQKGPNALATTITDPNGHKTTHLYDSSGRLSSVTDALGYSEQYSSYDTNNNPKQVQDKRGNFWKYTYDGMGNVQTEQMPPTAENSSGNIVTISYNSHNKPLTIKTQIGESALLTYDAYDNLTQVDDKDVHNNIVATTKFTVSASTYGLVTDKYDADNHHTHYDYTDGYGNLTAVTTPLGHKTTWAYNVEGVPTSRVAPGLNPNSPATITATYGLDDWNRTTSVTYSTGLYPGSDGNKTFAYDNDGNLTDFTNGVGHYTRSYDDDQRMLEEDKDGVMQVKHAYDASGQLGLLSSTTDASSVMTTFAYTQRDELSQSSQSGVATNYQYDASGNATTVNDGWGNFAAKHFDPAGRFDNLINRDPSGNYLSGYSYQYNKDSQKVGSGEYGAAAGANGLQNNGVQTASVTWGYDPLGHLSSEVRTGNSTRNASYVVDGVGNRTSQTVNGTTTSYTYDNDDEMTADSQGGVYQYDTGGSMIGRRRGGNWIYPYSTNEGQIAVIYTGGNYPAYSYGYDALGRRAFRTSSPSGGVSGTDAVRTDYQYDGSQVLTEKQGSTFVNRYQRGAGGELLTRPGFGSGSSGETPQMDGLGNMRQALSNGSSTLASSFDYSAFGELIGSSGGSSSPYGWGAQSGYRQDSGSGQGDCGLVLMGARWYDPATGRFTSRDSDITQSPYVYCDGDPVNFTDPSGHQKKPPKPKPPKPSPPSPSSQGNGGGDDNSNNHGNINDVHDTTNVNVNVNINVSLSGGNIIKDIAEGLENLKSVFMRETTEHPIPITPEAPLFIQAPCIQTNNDIQFNLDVMSRN